MLYARIVELNTTEITKTAALLREQHIKRSGSEELSSKRFPKYEWQRLSFVYQTLRQGGRCLEVGPGRRHLTTMLDREPKFDEIQAIDIVDHGNRLPKNVKFSVMDVTKMEFEDKYFDCVLCLEVLEHLSEEDFFRGLAEVRRVCKSQLLVSVPFNEPMPSKYHQQTFTAEKILDWFPGCKYSLLLKDPVMRVPWLLIEENM